MTRKVSVACADDSEEAPDCPIADEDAAGEENEEELLRRAIALSLEDNQEGCH